MKEFKPDLIKKNIFDIDYKELKNNGIKVLLFDLDNTISPYKIKDINQKYINLFKEIKLLGLKPIIFSNSPKKRVKNFADKLEIDFVYFALKPLLFKLNKVFKKYNINNNEAAIIGDQIFTDIKIGKKANLYTILVHPLTDYDPIWSKRNRLKEKKLEWLRDSYEK